MRDEFKYATKCFRRGPWLATALLLTALLGAHAEQPPARTYSSADGLPRDAVTLVRQDSRGFIWMAAGDGISRFDGYQFTNYTTDDGLPDRRVNDLLETRNGMYWMATDSGLCRFNPMGIRLRTADSGFGATASTRDQQSAVRHHDQPMFIVYNPGAKPIVFNVLLEDDAGAIWCGTSEGLYRLDASPDGGAQLRFVDLEMPSEKASDRNVRAVMKDRKGVVWSCTESGALYRLLPDARIERYTQQNGLPPGEQISALLEDHEGNVWVGTKGGLCKLIAAPDPSRAVVAQIYGTNDGLASSWIRCLYQTRDGKLWVGTTAGLCLLAPQKDASAPKFQRYKVENGLCDFEVWDVTEDRDGNLWVASICNVTKIARKGFTRYGLEDGLKALFINSIFENQAGELFTINAPYQPTNALINYAGRRINKFDGFRFTSVEPNLPLNIAYHGWGWGQTIIQDHMGEWWIPTGAGLYRFPKVDRIEELARARPQLVSMMGGDSNHAEVFRLYEDSRGDVWIATTGLRFGLWRWQRATNSVQDLTPATGVPPNTDFSSFCEDRAGDLWIGTSEGGGLLRYSEGKFKRFTSHDGVPPGWIISLYSDCKGRLWIGSQLGGLNRIDDPTADTLRITKYTTRDGLSSNNIRSITDDSWGRIYVGTGHGVDRLDTVTGNVKRYTVADGLPKNVIEHAHRDRNGALWFGSPFGLSRFVPEQQETISLPSVYITGLRIAGVARRVSELGETNLPQLELASDQNQVSVDFIGLGADLGEELRYQYRLEGADSEWSAPISERTINYAKLAPGAYRFVVRVVNADGQQSSVPASFTFYVRAPIWMHWWLWALIASIFSLTIYALNRYRVARLLEVANMRTRIATDLHDDIGAGLSRVAILSEVLKQQMGDTSRQSVPLLTEIAESARALIGSMRDIVWAINPQRDDLSNVVFRVRQFASDVLEPQKIRLDFHFPSELESIKLDAEQRRHLFLIFKEAINNIAHHANCRSVSLGISVSHNQMMAIIRDDGCGFSRLHSQEAPTNGHLSHGLENMRSRAEEIGGRLNVDSSPGCGTSLTLTFPLKKP
jgi:ligand-binding sensor domain-containing protein/signal transduction histidine kinase